MAFYNEKEQLHLETDVLGVGTGTSLLEAKHGMWFPKTEAPHAIAVASKGLSIAEPSIATLKEKPQAYCMAYKNSFTTVSPMRSV